MERFRPGGSHAEAHDRPAAGTYSVRHRDEGTWTFQEGILTMNWTGWGTVRLEPRIGFREPASTMVRLGTSGGH